MTPEPRGRSRSRLAVLTLAGVLLVAGPVVAGLRVAAAGSVIGEDAAQGTGPATVATTRPGGLPTVVDATTGQEPVTIEDALTPASSDPLAQRITWLHPDGRTAPVPNGSSLDLGGGVAVAITLTPYPPVDFDPATVEFAVTRDGTPVEGASLAISYDMRFMAHGPFLLAVTGQGPGRFTSGYHFFMFGPWRIDATLTVPGSSPVEFSIAIYVWPTT